MSLDKKLSRRDLLRASAVGSMGYFVAPEITRARSASPNEKLNIGMIGVANRAADNLNAVAGENLVVLCDVDEGFLNKAKANFPKADTTADWRKVIERKDIDAIVVATPDHTHAPATAAGLLADKHVYCEKPLTHDVYEARTVTKLAQARGKATQLGTQIHAMDNYRRVVELIESNAIGPVKEVHVWCGKSWGGGERPTDRPAVPKGLAWDLWLGPAPERPYHNTYHPFHWRKWWDFGGGTLADMGCHYIDVVFWSLKLRYPTRIEAKSKVRAHAETAAVALEVDYEFPARGDLPAVKMTWYDGGLRPAKLKEEKLPEIGDGVLFVGEKGMLLTNYTNHFLWPKESFSGFKKPDPYIPASIGHHQEWIKACKEGTPTTCSFDYSGPLTETVLLGVVSYRAGTPIEWNAEQMVASNNSDASRFLRREYRRGWSLT
jgi:predicted dehydrogenase